MDSSSVPSGVADIFELGKTVAKGVAGMPGDLLKNAAKSALGVGGADQTPEMSAFEANQKRQQIAQAQKRSAQIKLARIVKEESDSAKARIAELRKSLAGSTQIITAQTAEAQNARKAQQQAIQARVEKESKVAKLIKSAQSEARQNIGG